MSRNELPEEVEAAIAVALDCSGLHHGASYLNAVKDMKSTATRVYNVKQGLANMQHWRVSPIAKLVYIVLRQYVENEEEIELIAIEKETT